MYSPPPLMLARKDPVPIDIPSFDFVVVTDLVAVVDGVDDDDDDDEGTSELALAVGLGLDGCCDASAGSVTCVCSNGGLSMLLLPL